MQIKLINILTVVQNFVWNFIFLNDNPSRYQILKQFWITIISMFVAAWDVTVYYCTLFRYLTSGCQAGGHTRAQWPTPSWKHLRRHQGQQPIYPQNHGWTLTAPLHLNGMCTHSALQPGSCFLEKDPFKMQSGYVVLKFTIVTC